MPVVSTLFRDCRLIGGLLEHLFIVGLVWLEIPRWLPCIWRSRWARRHHLDHLLSQYDDNDETTAKIICGRSPGLAWVAAIAASKQIDNATFNVASAFRD